MLHDDPRNRELFIPDMSDAGIARFARQMELSQPPSPPEYLGTRISFVQFYELLGRVAKEPKDKFDLRDLIPQEVRLGGSHV